MLKVNPNHWRYQKYDSTSAGPTVLNIKTKNSVADSDL